MTPTLWTGIVVLIVILEVVRIAMTTYVLSHLLESRALRRHGEEVGQGVRSLRSSRRRAEREALLDPTLVAIRAAMDDVALGRAGSGVDQAIEALDRYAQVIVEPGASR